MIILLIIIVAVCLWAALGFLTLAVVAHFERESLFKRNGVDLDYEAISAVVILWPIVLITVGGRALADAIIRRSGPRDRS